MGTKELTRIKQDLKAVIDVLYQNTSIGRKKYNMLLEKSYINEIAKLVLKDEDVSFEKFKLSLFNLRDLKGKSSWSVIPIFNLPPPQKYKADGHKTSVPYFYSCFVGHRFVTKVKNNLRHNLTPLMEAYKINPVFADVDNASGALFDNIINDIEESDFCIFDTRETRNKPNVFIEVGIAYAKSKPFFFCEHISRKSDGAAIPSDLAGLQRVCYKDHRDFCHNLSILLPKFLNKHFIKEKKRKDGRYHNK